tara:strand:- start:3218 stop:4045 length:828 start_codon:yes stop_codon:yes gene_type:complete
MHKSKYLKYKKKYLELKKELKGGADANTYFDYNLIKNSSATMSEHDIYNKIKQNNLNIINELNDKFKGCDRISIIGKGSTAKYIKHGIGINHGLIFTNKKYLFMNDFEALFGLEEYIKDIDYIFFPDFPHIKEKSRENFNFISVVLYLNKYNFKGKIFIYQIHTTFCPIILDKYKFFSKTTTDIAITFFNKFLGIKYFELYGCGLTKLYHKDLANLNFAKIREDPEYNQYYDNFIKIYFGNFNNSTTSYNQKIHNMLAKHFEELRKKLKIEINLN